MNRVLLTLLLGLGLAQDAAAQSDQPAGSRRIQLAAVEGNCNADPGVAMLAASTLGQYVLSPAELMRGPDWQLFMHPAVPSLAFYHPPGWQPMPFAEIGTTGVRVVSPDNAAGFEIFNTINVSGMPTARQVAEGGLRNLIGADTPATLVCAFDYPVGGPLPTTAFFEAVTTQNVTAVASGMVIVSYTGAPAIDHRVVLAPRDQFQAYVRSVFLPVFTQLLGTSAPTDGGGGGIGGRGDDDDGDGEGDDDG